MENSKQVKYFEYNRKSSEGEDRQVQSIERQREENKKTIAQHNLRVVDTFSESKSAMIPNNRPAFNEMMKRITKGEANGIICWHINRLSRNPLESGIIQQMLSDGTLQSIQTKDKEYLPSDNLIVISVETGMSSQYSRDLGKSVKSGIGKKIMKGMAPISAPVGYLNTKHEERGANYIIRDPERFEIMRKAWDLMLSGVYTPPKILDVLTNEYGLRTRQTKRKGNKPLARSSIYRIFTDPFYAGLFVYKGITYQGTHDCMITLEEYDKVQILLGRAGRPRPKKHVFTYTGIIKCGVCGSAITACEKSKILMKTGKIKTYTFYHCTRRRKGADLCTQRTYLPEKELEKVIEKELNDYIISPRFLEFAIEVLYEDVGALAKQEQAIYDSKLKEVSKLENEIKTLLKIRLNDAISDEEYRNERTDREQKLFRIKQNIQHYEQGLTKIIAASEKKLIALEAMGDKFARATPVEKKAILVSLGENHSIKDKKLLITKEKWLTIFKQSNKRIESKITRLELKKNYTLQRKKEVLNLIRPLVRALVDDVTNQLQNKNYLN